MKLSKFIVGILLLVLSSLTSAEWLFAAKTSSGDELFFEPTRIKKDKNDPNLISLWELINHGKPIRENGKVISSTIVKVLFDCEKERRQILKMTSHAEKNGRGTVIDSSDYESPEWRAIVPHSPSEKVFKEVCD